MAIEIRSIAPRLAALRGFTALPGWLAATLVYLVLVAVFFWPTIVAGEAPLPLMNTYAQGDAAWSAYAPGAIVRGTNLLLGDVSGFYYPYVVFSIERLRAGDIPLWNPHIFGGVPYFAANQAALLYPVNLIAFSFGAVNYWFVAASLRLLIAGLGMYLLVRRLDTGVPGAILAGAVYMFADFNVVWLHFAIHNVAALLPLALWLIARLAGRPSRGTTLALAGVIAAQMLGGHPEMSLFFMVVCALFAAAWMVDLKEGTASLLRRFSIRYRSLGAVIVACALGLGLSAVQWLPTAMLIRGSYTFEERSFAAATGNDPASDYAPLGGVQRANWNNLRHWMLLVQPQFWGTPRGEAIRTWLPEKTNYNEMTPYVGAAALALALTGILFGRHRRAARFSGALFLTSLLLLYPLPGPHRIGFLPLLDIAYGFRFGLGIALAAAVLAGMGLDALLERCTERRERPLRRTAHDAGLRRLVTMPADPVNLTIGSAFLFAALSLAITGALWTGRGATWLAGLALDETQRAQIATVFQPGNWRLWLLSFATLALALSVGSLARRRALAVWSIVAIATGELVAYGSGYNGWSRPDAIYPVTRAIAHMKGDDTMFRIMPLDDTLWANSAMVHGLQVTSGMDDLKPADQGRFLKRGMAGIAESGDRIVVMDWGRRLLDLMNVRYIATRRPLESGMGLAPLTLELRDGDLALYGNDQALPRAYTASAYVPATRRTAEDATFAAGFDPQRAVVLEGDPGFASDTPAPITAATIVAYEPDRVILETHVTRPAILVLADAYDPDWQVTVNGAPAQLLRANAMFRAVAVPAGQSQVAFVYRPRQVVWGAGVSLASLMIVVAALATRLIRPLR
ncbi:MAG: YfhO family protein [Chloroflexi bacterium]|nr:YfhO family protein [Chloroflexota bacterium]